MSKAEKRELDMGHITSLVKSNVQKNKIKKNKK